MSDNALYDAQVIDLDNRRGEIALNRVHDLIGKYVIYPSPEARIAHALWIIHCHLMELWETTPRIAFLSPEPGSGKSRALEVTCELVPRPINSANVTAAYLIRRVADPKGRPTISLDEVDAIFGPKPKEKSEELRGLLNAGYRKGAVVGRCGGKTMTIPEEIPAYAAVALAGLGRLPDTILSRSVVVRMRKRRPDEKVEQFRQRTYRVQAAALRYEIEVWAGGILDEINWDEMKLPPEIQDRDLDIWEPLIAVADLAGGRWPALARDAAVTLVTAGKDTEPSLGVRLLADAQAAFGSEAFISTAQLLAALHVMDEAPWGDLFGKPLDARGLAKRLRQYGIKPVVERINPMSTARGYRRADFDDAWARYVPARSETNETAKQPVASVTAVSLVTLSAGGKRQDRRLPREDDEDPDFHRENPL